MDDVDFKTRTLIDPFFTDDLGLYIFGNVGTGKTFICHAIQKKWKEVIWKSNGRLGYYPEIKIYSIDAILRRIKKTFSKDYEGQDEEDLLAHFSGLKVKGSWDDPIQCLVIDDIGIEKVTDWSQQTIYTIVDRRYTECKKTIFTSNYSLDDLSERIGDRIPSRIAEMCRIIKLEGEDRRLQRR